MRIVRDPVGPELQARGSVVTIGAFDGVHLGHRAVLRLVRELADARDLDAALVTFDRHPAEIVRPESAPKLLTTLDHRLELLDATGLLDVCVVLTFDEARSHESAEEFVNEVLVGMLHARLVVVGADFHFGHKRGGNVALLEQMGADLGFEVLGLGLVAPEAGSVPFSSTRVRELLAAGDVAAAAAVLGRPHELRGRLDWTVLYVDERMCLPAAGLYSGTVTVGDRTDEPTRIGIGVGEEPWGNNDVVIVYPGAGAGEPAAVRLLDRGGR
ncbi:MAG: riboflavin kinase / adenylyltransferase [Actinomycetota bacterium]|jgi:riboflavin kinase/FMN adenylyltransferase|nr:riboflavin kinase / adenylyltransferase [Actinomycetota bacterium]